MNRPTSARARRSVAATIGAVALAAGMLGACGTQHGPISPSSSASSTPGETVSDPTLAGEITYYRTGGIAGFADSVILSPDGIASLERRGHILLRCKVKPGPLKRIAQTAAQASASPLASKKVTGPLEAPSPIPDMMYTGITYQGHKVAATDIVHDGGQTWKDLLDDMSTLFQQTISMSAPSSPAPTGPMMCDKI